MPRVHSDQKPFFQNLQDAAELESKQTVEQLAEKLISIASSRYTASVRMAQKKPFDLPNGRNMVHFEIILDELGVPGVHQKNIDPLLEEIRPLIADWKVEREHYFVGDHALGNRACKTKLKIAPSYGMLDRVQGNDFGINSTDARKRFSELKEQVQGRREKAITQNSSRFIERLFPLARSGGTYFGVRHPSFDRIAEEIFGFKPSYNELLEIKNLIPEYMKREHGIECGTRMESYRDSLLLQLKVSNRP